MYEALKLAVKGGRNVAPNPMVGAVIVKSGRIIGRGYHHQFGGAHAEAEAIRSVKNPALLPGSTLYVTLEPCRHYGKTPPCSDLIASVGIEDVVVGSEDPMQHKFRIQDSGFRMEFVSGKVAEECKELNKFFFTWITKKRPYITVKIAMSADGFVAGEHGQPVHFTSQKQDRYVHQLRAQHQAILVGIHTVLNDDPALTVRLAEGADPLRIVLDSQFRIPRNAKVLKDANHLIATTKKRVERGMNIWVSPTKKQVSFKKLFTYLATQGISSVLVEPGPTLYRALKVQGLIDEMIVLTGKKKIKKGLRLLP